MAKETRIALVLQDKQKADESWQLTIDRDGVSLCGGICPPESGFSLRAASARKLALYILKNTGGLPTPEEYQAIR